MKKPWFTVTRVAAHSPSVAFEVLTDFTQHSAPGTTVYYTSERESGTGATFNARTAVGPLAFDDNMVITDWQPPTSTVAGFCYIDKTGPLLSGQAQIRITPHPDGSHIEWREWITVGPQPIRWFSGTIARLVGPLVFGAVVRTLLSKTPPARCGAAGHDHPAHAGQPAAGQPDEHQAHAAHRRTPHGHSEPGHSEPGHTAAP